MWYLCKTVYPGINTVNFVCVVFRISCGGMRICYCIEDKSVIFGVGIPLCYMTRYLNRSFVYLSAQQYFIVLLLLLLFVNIIILTIHELFSTIYFNRISHFQVIIKSNVGFGLYIVLK